MDKFLTMLNSLGVNEQQEFALQCDTSIGYLRKACSAKQVFRPALCVLIEKATNGAIHRRDLRPNDWKEIWPELVVKTSSKRSVA